MLTDEQMTNVANWKYRLLYGGYSQTRGSLKDEHGYCCLGVAAEVLGHKFERGIEDYDFYYISPQLGAKLTSIIAHEDADELGFNQKIEPHELAIAVEEYLKDEPYSAITTRLYMLTKLNDTGCSFTDIVNYVERVGWDTK